MRNLFTLLFAFLLSITSIIAQDMNQCCGLSYKVLALDHARNFDTKDYTPGVEIAYTGYLTPSFNFAIAGRLASVNLPATLAEPNLLSKKGVMMSSLDIKGIYNFANGYVLRKEAKIAPYLLLGVGLNHYAGLSDKKSDVQAPLGLGVNIRFLPQIYLQIQSEYRASLIQERSNWVHGLGVQFLLGKNCQNQPLQLIEPIVRVEIDSDADGIVDLKDNCPYTPGLVSLQGCPEISIVVVEILSKARYIQFETASDHIKSESYPMLDEVVNIMKANPTYHLHIQGHTDSKGSDKSNVTLSQNRATAAFNYLTSKGVEAIRLQASGYGESSPIETNDTEEGRALNRRVEFIVH